MQGREGAARWSAEGEADEADLWGAMGLESGYGYHIEQITGEEGEVDDRSERVEVDEGEGGAPVAAVAYPCLDGHRYSGCLGAACPLTVCWTGGATVSAQQARSMSPRAGAHYLPGAPCHSCAYLGDLPEGVAPPSFNRTNVLYLGSDAGLGAGDRRGERVAAGGAGDRRVTCTRGLWEHPISLAALVRRRIPMREAEDAEHCPGFVGRGAPHPAVALYRRMRSVQARQQRAARRAEEG